MAPSKILTQTMIFKVERRKGRALGCFIESASQKDMSDFNAYGKDVCVQKKKLRNGLKEIKCYLKKLENK